VADRANDVRHKPEQMLGFIGIHPCIVAVDLSQGGAHSEALLTIVTAHKTTRNVVATLPNEQIAIDLTKPNVGVERLP
jgi:predicted methyltransferase